MPTGRVPLRALREGCVPAPLLGTDRGRLTDFSHIRHSARGLLGLLLCPDVLFCRSMRRGHTGSGLTLLTSLSFWEDPVSKYTPIRRCWWLGPYV